MARVRRLKMMWSPTAFPLWEDEDGDGRWCGLAEEEVPAPLASELQKWSDDWTWRAVWTEDEPGWTKPDEDTLARREVEGLALLARVRAHFGEAATVGWYNETTHAVEWP